MRFPEKTEGVLTFGEHKLKFKSEKCSFDISLERIADVRTRKETNMATMMGSYAALGMLGLVLMRKNKIGILTVSFKDPLGDLQQPQFAFIPRTVKEVNLIDDIAKLLYELRLKVKEE